MPFDPLPAAAHHVGSPRRAGHGLSTTCATTSAHLRAQTRDAHRAAEAALRIDDLRTRTALADLLTGWQSVWRGVLLAVGDPAACPTAAAELRQPAEQATAWLSSDLAFLAGDPCDDVAEPDPVRVAVTTALLRDRASSWGVAYVLRGSRLGGTMLAPALRSAVGLHTARGTDFLASAGTEPGREWVAFRRRLDGEPMSADDLDSALDAARWTFGWVQAQTAGGRRAGVASAA